MDNPNQPIKTPEVQVQTPPSVSNSTNTKLLIFILIGVALTLIAIGSYILGTKQTQPIVQNTISPTPLPTEVSAKAGADETANWKTYSYKNLQFKHPEDWVVIFDSTIFGQPNGFSLHVMHKNAGGYAPPALYLSTWESEYVAREFVLNKNRVFSKNKNNLYSIQFTVNGTTIYAGCGEFSEGQTTLLDICNQIVSTITIN